MTQRTTLDGRTVRNLVGLLVLVAVVAPFVVTAAPQVVGATGSYTVLSSSMSPAIEAGDVVVVDGVDPADVEERDVVTFHPPEGHQLASVERVTHRVVDVVERDGTLYFETKGDANEQADSALVPASNVVGTVWFTIPKIGYVTQFAGTPLGTVTLVIVPAFLLVVSEVYDLLMPEDDAEE
ncbi:signal peptidase [Halarchaeum rubridurum]|uniref:Signal peptidase n=1 Tax=Halarchaeum rubridurum TaxID=489911 RepID=A0A830FYI6_9EURY|nr:signal peptidase I [Halarchaeum rubridurum]MBP1953187.1 signal peptidase [Halarchaeum rubridurum]GGM67170.1 hypothetical protein GCM10009017_16680 [Halarchaeum rubridurum]